MKRLLSAALSLALTAGARGAQDEPGALKTDQDRMTYSLGYQIGQDFKREGVEVRPQAMRRGVADALAGAAPLMTPVQMRRTLLDLKREIKVKAAAEAHKQEAEARAKDEAFLAENAKKEGVVVLPSGLQYKVLQAGSGRQPQPNDTLTINYKATLPNGVVVDSTYKDGEPAKLRLDEVTVAGLRQALGLMREGARWEVYVPPPLGSTNEYSALRDRPMNYEVELISVAPAGGADAAAKP
jgi:FKBP-type peptidyl-prolyl cis-trans isomerase FklB